MSTELLPQLARRPASPQDSPRPAAGAGPYTLAFRRLRRDRVALGFGAIFLVIVLVSPGGLVGLWERAVALVFGRRRGPTDPNPIDVGQVEPSV